MRSTRQQARFAGLLYILSARVARRPRAGFAGLSGQAFALGELDVFAFAAAGFLADAFVDSDAFAAGTTARASLDRLMGVSRAGRRASRPSSSTRRARHQSSAPA